jgi:hypothetical protein
MRKKTPQPVLLSPVVVGVIKQRMDAIAHQQYLVKCMQAELERFVEEASGVSLRTETWELDLDHAMLRPSTN